MDHVITTTDGTTLRVDGHATVTAEPDQPRHAPRPRRPRRQPLRRPRLRPPEPDLVVVEAGRDTRYIAMPVTLVVEIVSPGNARHDTVTKLDAYERGGVDNCWMVDTRADGRRFHAVQLVDGRYETVAVSARTIDVTDPVKLELPLDDLFRTD